MFGCEGEIDRKVGEHGKLDSDGLRIGREPCESVSEEKRFSVEKELDDRDEGEGCPREAAPLVERLDVLERLEELGEEEDEREQCDDDEREREDAGDDALVVKACERGVDAEGGDEVCLNRQAFGPRGSLFAEQEREQGRADESDELGAIQL